MKSFFGIIREKLTHYEYRYNEGKNIMYNNTKRTHCVNCGKKFKRQYERTYSDNVAAMAKATKDRTIGGGWIVWDGETYQARAGLFCTLSCSLTFAEGAYNAGYKRRKKK